MKKTDSCRYFATWDTTSTVRSRPNRYLFTDTEFSETTPERWFPKALIPLANQAGMEILPEAALLRIHIGHLVHFLDYTTELEISYVNRAICCITQGALSQHFSSQERFCALKLYADEGYHALFSRELSDQVTNRFSLPRMRSARLHHLDRSRATQRHKHQELAAFIIAFVSETIITRELSWLSHGDLLPPILHMFQDHLIDESRHSIFFSDLFVTLWGGLSNSQKDFMATCLIKTILIFSRPNIHFIRLIADTHLTVIENAIKTLQNNWLDRISDSTALTMRAIKRTDLFKNHTYINAFRENGLPT